MTAEAFATAVFGKSYVIESAEFAQTLLREYSPDQPRDDKGSWTSDEASDRQAEDKKSAPKGEQKDLDTMVGKIVGSREGKKRFDLAKKAARDAGADKLTIKLEKPENLPNGEAAMGPRSGTIGIPDDASDAAMLEAVLVELEQVKLSAAINHRAAAFKSVRE